jgi:hypothetical protein
MDARRRANEELLRQAAEALEQSRRLQEMLSEPDRPGGADRRHTGRIYQLPSRRITGDREPASQG